MDRSRHVIAQSINARLDNEIIFTSGGTESDNTAIIQTAMKRQNEGRHIITTAVEPSMTSPVVEINKKDQKVKIKVI